VQKLAAALGTAHAEVAHLRAEYDKLFADWRHMVDSILRQRRGVRIGKHTSVTFAEAVAGVPKYGLPPTDRKTLYKWVRSLHIATTLGIASNDRLGKPAAMRLLVRGLIAMHSLPGHARGRRKRSENRRDTASAPTTPSSRGSNASAP
jgi:hypothetical protein